MTVAVVPNGGHWSHAQRKRYDHTEPGYIPTEPGFQHTESHRENLMPALITVRLALRVLYATPAGGYKDFTRSIKVPEVPRVGDTIYLDPTETAPRKVIAREWGFDGSPTVRLATIAGKSDNDPNEGAKTAEALIRDGWERDSTQGNA